MLKNFKLNLFKYNDKNNLSVWSLIVILFLDIFIINILIRGINDQKSLLITPDSYIPYNCSDFFYFSKHNINLNKEYLFRSIKNNFFEYQNNNNQIKIINYNNNQNLEKIEISEICKQLFAKLEELFKDGKLMNLIIEINSLYDQHFYVTDINQKNILNSKIKGEEAELYKYDSYKNFVNFINNNIDAFEYEKNKYEYWYSLKEFLFEMIFLIPLFLAVFIWHNRNIKVLSIKSLISSHILVITFVPILFNLIELFTNLIPKKILEEIWKILIQYNILILWYYIIIFLAVLLTVFIIYSIQKYIVSNLEKNKKNLVIYRLQNDLCVNCGNKITYKEAEYCYFCGFKRFVNCKYCNSMTLSGSNFCMKCGIKINDNDK